MLPCLTCLVQLHVIQFTSLCRYTFFQVEVLESEKKEMRSEYDEREKTVATKVSALEEDLKSKEVMHQSSLQEVL